MDTRREYHKQRGFFLVTSDCRIIWKAVFGKWELADWDVVLMVRDKGQR